jgi:DNA helicase-2/ATP-dependent DNA helicase PcrA
MDYDDVLEYVVLLVSRHEDVRADIYENYQYVLVDEHQDSSGIQNSFLKAVWGEIESPNIFVVGDDRQLIYAFSGAKLNYFEEFASYFGKTKLITLVDNYRSTEKILDLAHNLLQSTLSKEKLKSNTTLGEEIVLREYNYDRDEILGAGLYFKKLLDKGEDISQMAILVPRNYHVTNAISILESLNLPVVNNDNKSLFNLEKTDSFLRILNILNNPFDNISLGLCLLDKTSGIPPLEAHKFLEENKNKSISLETLTNYNKNEATLFASNNKISDWGNILLSLLNEKQDKLSHLVSMVGNKVYINNSIDHEDLLENVELVRTFIHLALLFENKKINPSLGEFLEYLARLKQYKNHIAVATLNKGKGIEVMTLHKSKGLEYKYVWIAHMNEETVMSEKRNPFSLPEYVKERLAKRNIEDAKRELYVAITRAREFCNISYSAFDLKGSELTLSPIIKDLDEVHFIKKDKEENESELLNNDINGAKIFTSSIIDTLNKEENTQILKDLNDFVKDNYKDIKVSVSLLNNFFECPFKWYFRNFLKLPEVKSSSLALGSSVHNTIEFILKNKKSPNTKVIKDFIKDSLKKEGISEAKDLIRLEKEAFSIIENWTEDFYPNLAENFQSERSLSLRDKNLDILIYGKLDLTEIQEDGSIIITDFKTGKPKTKNEIEKFDEEGRMSPYMRQLAMYSYLVLGAGNTEVRVSRLLFLEADPKDKNKVYQTSINEEQIDLLKRDINDYVESLENVSWVERKCNFKPFGGKNEPCPHCTLAQNIFLK